MKIVSIEKKYKDKGKQYDVQIKCTVGDKIFLIIFFITIDIVNIISDKLDYFTGMSF